LIDFEGELHAFDGSRPGILAGLSETFLLLGALADEVGGLVALEVGSFELFDGAVI
jgi:hypothetical protein